MTPHCNAMPYDRILHVYASTRDFILFLLVKLPAIQSFVIFHFSKDKRAELHKPHTINQASFMQNKNVQLQKPLWSADQQRYIYADEGLKLVVALVISICECMYK